MKSEMVCIQCCQPLQTRAESILQYLSVETTLNLIRVTFFATRHIDLSRLACITLLKRHFGKTAQLAAVELVHTLFAQ